MNYTPLYGWYYLSPAERTPSWTGVEFLRNFLVGNTDVGPYASEREAADMQPGDIVQLGREGAGYYHTLLVVGRAGEDLLLAANSDDAFERPLSSYNYDFARFLHIEGVRLRIPDTGDCFTSLIEGLAILPDSSSLPPLPPPEEMPPEEPDGEMPSEEEPEGETPTEEAAEETPVFLSGEEDGYLPA